MHKLIIVENDGNVIQSSFDGYHAEDCSDQIFRQAVEGRERSLILLAITIDDSGAVRQRYVAGPLT